MDQAKQQVVETIKGHSNILVTVSTNPSVDELAAAIGLTVMLNNLDKRATSVFSGSIPPAINFLEPDKTFENSADSLRDFIIALDKEKADHLRYKVEGESVKIFITPYKTRLSEKDLQFSQGDYNVELVIAIGVTDQGHLDKALESHGKILHDATVLTITAGQNKSNLGSMDWHDDKASSLSEMIAGLTEGLKGEQPLLDQQISTALMTGIVSATDRFSNERTTSSVMTVAAQLMAAGANQQLIAAKLEEAHDIAPSKKAAKTVGKNNSSSDSASELSIDRPGKKTTKAGSEPVAKDQNDPQAELEKHLEAVTSNPTGTMADIEQQLKQESAQQPVGQPHSAPVASEVSETPPPTPSPVNPPEPVLQSMPDLSQISAPPNPELPTAVKDTAMPGFEPTGALASSPPPPPSVPPESPVAAPVGAGEPPKQYPEIIQRHDNMAVAPQAEGAPAINSIQNGPEDGQASINPFDGPLPSAETKTVEPTAEPVADSATNIGTPEGAALLNSSDMPDTPPPQPAPVGVPELPPLPPMPANVSNMPLPPPPPPPPSVAMGDGLPSMPSGAVSGDVFGDNTAPPAQDQPPAAPAPGQFRIPGQQ